MDKREWKALYRAWRVRSKDCLNNADSSQWAWDTIWNADTRACCACRYAREAREDRFRSRPVCAIDLLFGPIRISGPRHRMAA